MKTTAIVTAGVAYFLVLGGCRAAPPENAAPETPPPPPAAAEGLKQLPPPDKTGGTPLFAALAGRRSNRNTAGRALTDAEIGQLLWAGEGITSAEGKRTAPSAGAIYPLSLYVVDAAGTWRYDAAPHALELIREGDSRAAVAKAGYGQKSAADAAAIIVIVGQPSLTAAKYKNRAERYCTLEAGHVCQNVLLAASDLGFNACPLGSFDDAAVRACLGLSDDYVPYYLIPVGAPAPGTTGP